MKRFRIFSKKTIIGGSVIFISFLFILMAFSPVLAGTGQQTPQAITEKSYIPNPTLNTNISWNTFYRSWSELEYNNGTGNKTLSTGLSTLYKNPITVNPAGIQSPAFTETLGTSGIYWNKTYNTYGGNAGALRPGAGKITMVTSSSNTTPAQGKLYWNISSAYIPSLNPQYDYVTILYTSTQTGTGNTYIGVSIGNGSEEAGINGAQTTIQNETSTPSKNHANPTTGTVFESLQASDFVGNFKSGYMQIGLGQNLPETTTKGAITVNTTILGLMLTSNPVSLGTFTNATGQHPITGMETADRQDVASAFNPDFSWSSITNNGYSVAVGQTMQNITESQASISDGSYIEQATYQGTLSLPTAPDLTYSASNITLNMTLPGKQYEVATLNGISYLSNIQAKDNGTFVFGSVNPNTPNSMILEAKYTASQWDSSTHAPSFFTLRGLEYYWWVGVIGGLSIIGLGAAAASHFGGDEETLRVPKGKFGR